MTLPIRSEARKGSCEATYLYAERQARRKRRLHRRVMEDKYQRHGLLDAVFQQKTELVPTLATNPFVPTGRTGDPLAQARTRWDKLIS